MEGLIIYIPALHRGYLDFLKMHSNMHIFLLDLSLVREEPRMERDIRAINTKDILNALKGIGFSKVKILTKENLSEINNFKKIIMLEEDVSYDFANNYLKKKNNVEFISFFLRWDKHNSEKKNIITPDRKISKSLFDKEIIEKAYIESYKSSDWWRQIGAVLVKNKKIILTGFNKALPNSQTHNILGDPRSNFDYGISFELSKFIHAEALIIAESAKRGIKLDGTSIYVTTFPCPVCAKSIAISGIKKVYYKEGYSLLDSEDILKSFGVEIIHVE